MAEIGVEVAYAGPEGQVVLALRVAYGMTAWEAVTAVRSRLPAGVEPAPERLGIYARKTGPDQILEDGDRVELYRPLTLDPMEARRLRAKRGA